MSKNTQMPVEVQPELFNNPPTSAIYPPVGSVPEFEVERSPVPLSRYLWVIRHQLWKIAAFVAACVFITFVFSVRLKPIYESTATIDVDMQAPSEIVGQGAAASSNTEDPDVFLATQIRLIQSDAVLRPVAEQFNLINRELPQDGSNAAGAQDSARAPVSLGGLRVTRPSDTYLLLISYRSPDSREASDVANAVATSYLAHTYDIRIRSSASLSSFMEKQLDELRAKMERSSLALAQFEKDLEVINPEEKTNILSSRLLQLNTEYTTAQAERIREEATWNAMKSGSVEAAEISPQGESLSRLSDTLNQALQRFAEVKATFGVNHPEYRKAATALAEAQKQFDEARNNISGRVETAYHESLNREQMLQSAVAETKAEWDQLNARSFQYQQLKQEAGADKALYDELTTKIHEASINAGFQNNNVRIADSARPSLSPVYPDIKQNLLLAFLLSTILAVGAVILLDSLDTTLRDPDEAGRFLGADVIGTLPLDNELVPFPNVPGTGLEEDALAEADTIANGTYDRTKPYRRISSFEEAVRSVRNTILLSDFEQRLHSIMLTSAVPEEGKTTLAIYLAIAHAASGKKTLLVDGDLRRPSIHARFNLSPREGLSNVLTGEMDWRDVVIPIENRSNLSLLPSGPGSRRAADLIGPRLAELLDEFGKQYDLVILDSPPLLGFAECLQMANAADGVLIIAQAGKTRRKAVAAVVSMLQRVRVNVIGVVLNRMTHKTSADAYSYQGEYGYDLYHEREPEGKK